MLTSIELCAGAGGQALGLERAGFCHVALNEIDTAACATLRANRPRWNVVVGDIAELDGHTFDGVDLVAGGVPCPPFSVAGHRLGSEDDRDLFPQALRIVSEARPKAVLLENVRGLLDPAFAPYRQEIVQELARLGYPFAEWRLINSSDFGVPQLRPRAILVALRRQYAGAFSWPDTHAPAPSVGEALVDLMAERGWNGAEEWAAGANDIGPTLVGGSKKHGGPDLGPTRARQAWARLGVDGRGLADFAPDTDFEGMPRLTVRMAARIQGFPDSWKLVGKKTPAYRQVGNAFPPPVAEAVGVAIATAIIKGDASHVGTKARIESPAPRIPARPRRASPDIVGTPGSLGLES